jgi:hypothetical protein
MTALARLVTVAAMAATAATVDAEVKVADDVWNGPARFSGLDYGVSERFNRAWLVLHFTDEAPCRGSDGRCEFDEPVRVPVLDLLAEARELVLLVARRAVTVGRCRGPAKRKDAPVFVISCSGAARYRSAQQIRGSRRCSASGLPCER